MNYKNEVGLGTHWKLAFEMLVYSCSNSPREGPTIFIQRQRNITDRNVSKTIPRSLYLSFNKVTIIWTLGPFKNIRCIRIPHKNYANFFNQIENIFLFQRLHKDCGNVDLELFVLWVKAIIYLFINPYICWNCLKCLTKFSTDTLKQIQ